MSGPLAGSSLPQTPNTASQTKNVDDPIRHFETRWQEERWLRDVMSGWPSERGQRADRETNEYFRGRAEVRRELIRRRLEVGFECHGEEIGGRWREPFVEEGLRSEKSHVLRRIVQLTPRASRMATGRSKDVMRSTDSKLLGLDDPYVVLNSKVRGVFRLDLDLTFRSWETLRWEVSQLPLPCLPHAAVAFETPDGSVERPHLLYLLPYGAEVWFDPDDDRCRRDVMSFWRGVHAGMCKTFLPLGADPGGLANAMRIKNPLSPFWTVQLWNETHFPDLSEWAGWVDTSVTRDTMIRESAAALSGAERRASNALFTTLQEWSYAALREMHGAGETAYVSAVLRKDRDALAELLFDRLVGRASKMADRPKQARAILYRVVTYAADHWDPSRASRDGSRVRGACAPDVEEVSGVRNRQVVGARYAADLRGRRSLERLVSAMREATSQGIRLTKAGMATSACLARPTVHKHWHEALARLHQV